MNFNNYKQKRKFSFIIKQYTAEDLLYKFPNIIKVDKPIIKIRIKESNMCRVLLVETTRIPESSLYEHFDLLKDIPTIILYKVNDMTATIGKYLHVRFNICNLQKEEFEIL